ncbi:chlorophyll synthesis pathway protein BchC [Alkalicaulis satelles]|uniref:Chlorophyll synthesis pathway protein BchC n=1 Tax=Alkalicaulis satelles TaxID=2609175 RepID=A0A5M6ZGZ5_9PROT|nr:chlorophyll synthesis pathway protein BchC [Alkalicaulis satelles]KAA5804042.1 chlorophyll synthesis pathway protein BchC [Alkalicaulis satelles]
MDALAIVLEEPKRIALNRLAIAAAGPQDVVVEIAWSGVSTGTERLLWSGAMPPFPGMGYPLVPGYESIGRVIEAGADSGRHEGDWVFVPGAQCFGAIRGLFGGSASRVTVPGARVTPVDENLGERGVMLALAATAWHAMAGDHAAPDLIIGHGALGRLLARLTLAAGAPAPVVWEINPDRMDGAEGYRVLRPEDDPRRDYRAIYDVSGDANLLDSLVGRLAKGGEIVLAGFYAERLSFNFAPAFMKEARLRIAAEFSPADLDAVGRQIASGALGLDGLITHHSAPGEAGKAYDTAFTDASCLKMVIDWRTC